MKTAWNGLVLNHSDSLLSEFTTPSVYKILTISTLLLNRTLRSLCERAGLAL